MKAALEGEYEYKVWGTDKAGNAAAVTECFTGPASDRTGTKSSDRKDWKKRTEGCSEDFTPRFTIIIDRTAPRITMEYKNTFLSRRQDTSGINPRAYIYADRGKVLAGDGKVEGGLSVYVSGRTDVTLSLEEKYPDPGRLFCSRYCAVPDPSSGRKKEILKVHTGLTGRETLLSSLSDSPPERGWSGGWCLTGTTGSGLRSARSGRRRNTGLCLRS